MYRVFEAVDVQHSRSVKSDETTRMSMAEVRDLASLSVSGLTRLIGQLRARADFMRPALDRETSRPEVTR